MLLITSFFHNTMLNVWPHDSDWAMGSGAILFVTMSWNILARDISAKSSITVRLLEKPSQKHVMWVTAVYRTTFRGYKSVPSSRCFKKDAVSIISLPFHTSSLSEKIFRKAVIVFHP